MSWGIFLELRFRRSLNEKCFVDFRRDGNQYVWRFPGAGNVFGGFLGDLNENVLGVFRRWEMPWDCFGRDGTVLGNCFLDIGYLLDFLGDGNPYVLVFSRDKKCLCGVFLEMGMGISWGVF